MFPSEVVENIISFIQYSEINSIVLLDKYNYSLYSPIKNVVIVKDKINNYISTPKKRCLGCFYYDDKNKIRCNQYSIKNSSFCNLCGFNINENSISFNDFVYLNRVF